MENIQHKKLRFFNLQLEIFLCQIRARDQAYPTRKSAFNEAFTICHTVLIALV